MNVVEARAKRGDASDGAAAPVLGARILRDRRAGQDHRQGACMRVEHRPENLVHAVIVPSAIAAGRVTAIDAEAAKASPGVLLVLTPDNILPLNSASTWLGTPGPEGPYRPLVQDVTFSGQYVAAIVAETFEQATAAAALVKVSYDEAAVIAGIDEAGDGIAADAMTKEWGDAEAALAAAPVRIEHEYRTPREYQAPLEPHGLIAQWEGDRLTIWEPSQWLDGMARTYAEWFGIPFENVRLISPYIGGGFGSKGFTYAARRHRRHSGENAGAPGQAGDDAAAGLRQLSAAEPETRQTIALGATKDGKLTSIVHRGVNETSMNEVWVEPLGSVTSIMYATPNFSSRQNVVRGEYSDARRACARQAKTRAPSASNARSTSWPTRSASTRWQSGCSTMRRRIRTPRSHGRRGSCAKPLPPARTPSAGRSAIPRRDRCATATR